MEVNIRGALVGSHHLLHHDIDLVDVVAAPREVRIEPAFYDRRLEPRKHCQFLAGVFLDNGGEIHRLLSDNSFDCSVCYVLPDSALKELLTDTAAGRSRPQ